jgi:hypothetical protein
LPLLHADALADVAQLVRMELLAEGTKPNRTFLLFKEAKTYGDAMQACFDKQAQLATFLDKADQTLVANRFYTEVGTTYTNAWLGLASRGYPDEQADSKGAWMWLSTGVRPQSGSVENWKTTEPGPFETTSVCGAMDITSEATKSQWSDQ